MTAIIDAPKETIMAFEMTNHVNKSDDTKTVGLLK
jgi:hypothetical protein